MRFASSIALGLLAASLVSTPALAATASASFGVTVTVLSSCAASTPAAAFGNSATDASSPVSINCTNPTAYNVSLSADLAAPANSLPAHRLPQTLAQRNGSSRILGNYSLASTNSGALDAGALFRQSAQRQAIAPGAFADSVTVTVVY